MRISDWSSDVCSSDLFEDFKPGQVFRTPEFVATAENIISFAKHYDPKYYHLDAERARNSIFEGLVCGGFQTAALISEERRGGNECVSTGRSRRSPCH